MRRGAVAVVAGWCLLPAIGGCGSESSAVQASGHGGDFVQAAGSPLKAGQWPQAVAVGEFNGDGHADLAVTNNAEPTVTILLGDGDGDGAGGFRPAAGGPVRIPTGAKETLPDGSARPHSTAVGDFDSDGHADLAVAVATRPNNVTILLGDGTGRFTVARTSPELVDGDPRSPADPISVTVADFDGDRHPDLATANVYAKSVTVLLGKGNGDFTRPAGSPTKLRAAGQPAVPTWVTSGDVNGDGNPDVLTANTFADQISVLLGDGTGKLTEAPTSPVAAGKGPSSLALADLDGDKHLDVAVSDYGGNEVTILLGDGAGKFAPDGPVPMGIPDASPMSVVVGAFGGDDHPDLAVGAFTQAGGRVLILLGDGTGKFVPAPTGPEEVVGSPGMNSQAVGDFDSDGRDDLAVTDDGDADSTDVTILLQR